MRQLFNLYPRASLCSAPYRSFTLFPYLLGSIWAVCIHTPLRATSRTCVFPKFFFRRSSICSSDEAIERDPVEISLKVQQRLERRDGIFDEFDGTTLVLGTLFRNYHSTRKDPRAMANRRRRFIFTSYLLVTFGGKNTSLQEKKELARKSKNRLLSLACSLPKIATEKRA